MRPENCKEVEENGGQDELGARGEEVEKSLGEHRGSRKKDDGHVVKLEEPERK